MFQGKLTVILVSENFHSKQLPNQSHHQLAASEHFILCDDEQPVFQKGIELLFCHLRIGNVKVSRLQLLITAVHKDKNAPASGMIQL